MSGIVEVGSRSGFPFSLIDKLCGTGTGRPANHWALPESLLGVIPTQSVKLPSSALEGKRSAAMALDYSGNHVHRGGTAFETR